MNQVSPMWKIPAAGITADDFMNRDSENAPRAFYGRMWRFANDQDFKRALAAEKARNAGKPEGQDLKSLDNFLVDEARKKGLPVPTPDTATPEEQAAAMQALADQVKPAFTEDQLKDLPREQLVELASAVGVANLNQKKEKLIEAILDRQG